MENDLTTIASRTERHASKPRYRAEDLIYEAWEASGPRRAVLARQALALWPDCADAYVLLTQAASSLEEARELLERGVAAGERAIGQRVFVEDAGDFWLIFQTRPYMRARAALAATLWRLGRREEAVAHQRELLRLNSHVPPTPSLARRAKRSTTPAAAASCGPACRARSTGSSPDPGSAAAARAEPPGMDVRRSV
ncbi:MAG: hypothetical protein ACLP0J_10660 [Solirubrobacteraceae bacterium]